MPTRGGRALVRPASGIDAPAFAGAIGHTPCAQAHPPEGMDSAGQTVWYARHQFSNDERTTAHVSSGSDRRLPQLPRRAAAERAAQIRDARQGRPGA
ncbi:protein of unknown function [Methylorubrum extorquens]|uniref:Uncharacterized protein n=1 Tax=Methylorubrum extorquens TaxID=408 RepID=A0A2N9AUU0_METEX|nr:protein of unknown function [Methylorubrum extorquens]